MDKFDPTTMRDILSALDYPCDQAGLIRQAAAHGADDDVLGHLCALPPREYQGPGEVNDAFAEQHQQHQPDAPGH